MKRATTIAEYLTSPTGLYVASTSFLAWCAEPELYGFAVWGCPDETEIRQLCTLLDVEVRPEAQPHASLVDLRHLQGVHPQAFAVFASHMHLRSAQYRERVTRQARVRPSGLYGALVAGFGKIVPPSHPVSLHESASEAIAWLCGSERPELVEELEALVAAAMGELPVVEHLRRVLVPPLMGVTLESSAKLLGTSARTLQRRIQREGTTFQTEYSAAQLRAAKALLLETEMTVSAIAKEVGYTSLANFSAMFRRHTGESPSEWRKRSRIGIKP